jgi:hypothetical protein
MRKLLITSLLAGSLSVAQAQLVSVGNFLVGSPLAPGQISITNGTGSGILEVGGTNTDSKLFGKRSGATYELRGETGLSLLQTSAGQTQLFSAGDLDETFFAGLGGATFSTGFLSIANLLDFPMSPFSSRFSPPAGSATFVIGKLADDYFAFQTWTWERNGAAGYGLRIGEIFAYRGPDDAGEPGAVPEPSTYGIVGLAVLLGLIVHRRRLRQEAKI